MSNISPLFALEAEELIRDGKFNEAFELCLDGTDEYPDYPLGHRMLILSLAEGGYFDKVDQYIEIAKQDFPNHTYFNNIENEIFEKYASDAHASYQEMISEKDDNADDDNQIENTSADDSNFTDSEKSSEIQEDETISDKDISLEDVQQDEELHNREEDSSEETETEEAGTKTQEEETEKGKKEEAGTKTQEAETEETMNIMENDSNDDVNPDSFFDVDIETINYQYTGPTLCQASSYDLIPGMKPNTLEASNLDADNKIKKYANYNKLDAKQPVTDKYAKIAKELQSSSIDKSKTKNNIHIDTKPNPIAMVSETLASIYYQQGAYNEAISAYKKLITSKPEETEKYQKIIDDIKLKIKNA